MRRLPLLLLAACAAERPVPLAQTEARVAAPSPVLAQSDGWTVTQAELDRYVADRPKLTRQLYDLRKSALEELTLDRLVAAEAKRAGLSEEVWLRGQVDKRTTKPSDREIKAFFDTRMPPGAGYHYDDVAPQIRDHLLGERRQAALHEVLDGLRGQAHLKLLLAPPRIQLATSGPSRGPANAPVTIVEFSDYQCPYCQRQEEALRQLTTTFPTQVRVVVQDFPLDKHPDAGRAARAAVCADTQGKFWEMHDRLFDDPGSLSTEDLKATARKIGLDGARFDSCLDSAQASARVEQSQREGEEAGVDGTPALFLNGRPFSGAVSFSELKATVEEELALSTPSRTAKGAP